MYFYRKELQRKGSETEQKRERDQREREREKEAQGLGSFFAAFLGNKQGAELEVE